MLYTQVKYSYLLVICPRLWKNYDRCVIVAFYFVLLSSYTIMLLWTIEYVLLSKRQALPAPFLLPSPLSIYPVHITIINRSSSTYCILFHLSIRCILHSFQHVIRASFGARAAENCQHIIDTSLSIKVIVSAAAAAEWGENAFAKFPQSAAVTAADDVDDGVGNGAEMGLRWVWDGSGTAVFCLRLLWALQLCFAFFMVMIYGRILHRRPFWLASDQCSMKPL